MNETVKQKALKKAYSLGAKATSAEVRELDSKLPAMKKGVIAKIWDKVLFLWEQIKSPEIPTRLKVVIIGALLYLVLPIDVLPDYIPGIGFLDDVAVILAVVREVSKFAIPEIEKKLENKFYEISYQKIDQKLSKLFSSILITTICTFLLNAVVCSVLIIKPFGTPYSQYIAISIFVLIFVYALIRFVLYLKDYGKMTRKIAVSVCKKKSISEGIADFVGTEYKYIAYLFSGLEIVKSVVPELNQIPDAPKIVATFEKHYKKRIILFVLCLLLYTMLITITKMILFQFN